MIKCSEQQSHSVKTDLTPPCALYDAQNTELQQNGLSSQTACNLVEGTKLMHIKQQHKIKSWRC